MSDIQAVRDRLLSEREKGQEHLGILVQDGVSSVVVFTDILDDGTPLYDIIAKAPKRIGLN